MSVNKFPSSGAVGLKGIEVVVKPLSVDGVFPDVAPP